MKHSFMIINYNDFETTKKLYDIIKKYKCIDYVLIVDNSENTKEHHLLDSLDVDTLYIKNKGYANAINEGCKYIDKKIGNSYIAISNSDIIINKEEDLLKLYNDFNDDIAIVGPKIKQNDLYSIGWALPRVKDEIIFNIPRIGRKYRDKLMYNTTNFNGYVDVVSGCFFIIDSRVLPEINYLDENTFLYYEENILSIKVSRVDKRVFLDDKVIVNHNHSVTINKSINKIKKYKIQKQSQYYFCKNYLNANIFELFLLKLTYFITYIVLYIYYKITDIRGAI